MSETRADFVVVGASSADCVLANRLSANPHSKVVLLEVGGKDWNRWIYIPDGYFKTIHNPKVDWGYKTETDPGLNRRSIEWPRGTVLGGSSSLIGLLHVRGQPRDYDRWLQMGNAGWEWDDVLPLFKRAENNERGADEYHGEGGPLSVCNMRIKRPITDAWVAAAQTAGYRFNADYNGADQEGVGFFQLTARKGRRCSAAVAYLKPAKQRDNLQIITHAQVEKVVIEDKCAVALVYTDNNGAKKTVRADREIGLVGGAINSPQIKMLSGIGEPAQLAEHGIDVVHGSPEAGEDLHVHLQARLVYKRNEPTQNDKVVSLFGQKKISLKYIVFRLGPMTMAARLAMGFLNTRKELETPNVQFHVQPLSAENPGKGGDKYLALTMSVCQLRPESKVEIRLGGADPKNYPNYLSAKSDCRTIVDGVNIARKIARFAALDSKISEESRPHSDLDIDYFQATLDWTRSNTASIYHPNGSCRMGIDDQAVVDPLLRVHGIKSLWVADRSIMPEIVSVNTNAPAIMIGEKASDLILEGNPT